MQQRPALAFVRSVQQPRERPKPRELPKQEEHPEEATPPVAPMPSFTAPAIRAPRPEISAGIPELPMQLAGPILGPVRQPRAAPPPGPVDREMIAVSRTPPQYPYRAQRRGTEGWVRLSFEVTEAGEVRDVVVMEAEPSGVFDRAAIRAVEKWKFKPRIRNGMAVSARTDQTIQFRLRQEDT